MVIFHGYVSLPEGIPEIGSVSSFRQILALSHLLERCWILWISHKEKPSFFKPLAAPL
jgi:hypothetical protein